MKPLDEKRWLGRQSSNFEALWETDTGEKLRVSIKRGSDDEQSHARVEIYDPAGRRWNFLAHVPPPEMASLSVNAYRSESGDAVAFHADEEALLNMARLILMPGVEVA